MVKENVIKFKEQKAKAPNTNAKPFKSCINEPLSKAKDDKDLLLRCIPPCELHLLLRVTNKLYKELEACDQVCAKEWIEALSLERPKLHSGEFTRNQCKRLLKNTQVLKDIIRLKFASSSNDSELCRKLRLFFYAFQAFDEVVHSCFGNTLKENYSDSIKKFQIAYLKLHITVPTSAHILFNPRSSVLWVNEAKSQNL